MSTEYAFRIGAHSPDTIPMARLAEYMAGVADLVGQETNTHFVRLDEGSTELVHRIDDVAAPKVAARLRDAASTEPPEDLRKALAYLDDLLANDNATGALVDELGAEIIAFPGCTRPKPLTFPSFRQDGSIDGQIVSIGGKDKSAHVILQDGKLTYANIQLDRDMARDLGKHLYGAKIRLIGSGRWERLPTGAWRLIRFDVDRYAVLDETPLGEVLDDLRRLGLTGDGSSIYDRLTDLRAGGDDVH